jgi:hypothetical protein
MPSEVLNNEYSKLMKRYEVEKNNRKKLEQEVERLKSESGL